MPVTVVVRSASGGTTPSLTFDGSRIVIGRSDGSDVRLPDPSVSQRHASIRAQGAEYALIDEGSTNGTWVGGVKLGPRTPRTLPHFPKRPTSVAKRAVRAHAPRVAGSRPIPAGSGGPRFGDTLRVRGYAGDPEPPCALPIEYLELNSARDRKMRNPAALCLVALLTASCAGALAASSESVVRVEAACDTLATTEWRGTNNRVFRANASTSGANCAQSVVLLVVRDSSGDVVWTDALVAAHVMGLNEPTTQAAMTRALADWVRAPTTRPRTTADLAPWAQTSGHRGESEFPFRPEEWIDEVTYERLAGEAKPMFCYVQGMESIACLVEFDDRLEKVGVQSFPG